MDGLERGLSVVLADNPSPFTLDGTRTYLVGAQRVALIDPGPDSVRHIDRLAQAVSTAETVTVLLTHGHPDHAAGLDRLVARLEVDQIPHRIRGVGHPAVEKLGVAEAIDTDAGSLSPISTPGHSREHLAFLWNERSLFVGDLFLGEGDTTWVGEYPGCVAEYLASLGVVRDLAPRILYPAHGSPLRDVEPTIARYEYHRGQRIEQAREALLAWPTATIDELMGHVYGELPQPVQQAARMSLQALVEFVRDEEEA